MDVSRVLTIGGLWNLLLGTSVMSTTVLIGYPVLAILGF